MILELINVQKTYTNASAKKIVLDTINLSVSKGEFVCILGRSGCGKTTLLHIAAGLMQPTSGSVRFNENNAAHTGPNRVLLFQEPSLFPWLTVIENIEFGLAMSGVSAKERKTRALNALETVHLKGTEHLCIHQLSGGMQQRVALARALVMNSALLLMDEPFSALDHGTKTSLRLELLNIWKKCGTTILLVTHDVDEAMLLADRIVVISSETGKIGKECTLSGNSSERNENADIKILAANIKKEFGIARDGDENNQ